MSRVTAAAVALLALAGCGRGVKPTAGPVALAYGGAPGTTRAYEFELGARGRVALHGMPQLVALTLSMDVREDIEAALPDGTRRVRMRYRPGIPEINGMPAPVEDLPEEMDVVLTRSPDGTTSGEHGAAALAAEPVRWLALALGGEFPRLPGAPVRPGVSWTRTRTLDLEGGGRMTFSATGELIELGEDGVALIALEARHELSRPDAETGIRRLKLSSKGEARFDVDEGAVIEMRQAGRVDLKLRAGKTRVDAAVRFTSSLQRVGRK